MRYDERHDNLFEVVRSGYIAPSIRVGNGTTRWYAMIGFLEAINSDVAVHLANMGVGDAETAFDALRNTGSAYRNDDFSLHAYDWDESYIDEAFDDELGDIPAGYLDPNSDCFHDVASGAAASWYKNAWHGLWVNETLANAIDDGRSLGEIEKRIVESMHKIEDERIRGR